MLFFSDAQVFFNLETVSIKLDDYEVFAPKKLSEDDPCT